MSDKAAIRDQTAAARLAASWLLWYPDDALIEKLPEITQVVETCPSSVRDPLRRFLA